MGIFLREVLNVVAVAFIQKQNGDVLMPAGFMFSYGWRHKTQVSCSQCK